MLGERDLCFLGGTPSWSAGAGNGWRRGGSSSSKECVANVRGMQEATGGMERWDALAAREGGWWDLPRLAHARRFAAGENGNNRGCDLDDAGSRLFEVDGAARRRKETLVSRQCSPRRPGMSLGKPPAGSEEV